MVDRSEPEISRCQQSAHTLGSKAGVGEVVGLGLGLADLEFGFLGVSVTLHSIDKAQNPHLEVLLLLLLALGTVPHPGGVNGKSKWKLMLFSALSHVIVSVDPPGINMPKQGRRQIYVLYPLTCLRGAINCGSCRRLDERVGLQL
jgi:hypothetical protein